MASRREGIKVNDEQQKTSSSIMQNVDNISGTIREISDNLVKEYCKDLDNIMSELRQEITSKEIDNYILESYIMELANTLYFTGSAQEDLGIKEDICKSIRQEVYSKAREQATGKTVADKTAQAELIAQAETMSLSIYSRAYEKVKLRMDAGYEMLNSLKKVMNKRIAESLTPNLVKYYYIKQWEGVLPKTVLGEDNSFMISLE